MLDIESLRVIWWLLLGVLFTGFAVMDGFDFGAAILMPIIAKNDQEKRIILNSVGPYWEGNQVWILLAAGAIFAAWPLVYAVVFSGVYFPVLLLLLTMGIMRPVGIKYRSKLPNTSWRTIFDTIIFLGGFFPAILFGVLIANIMQGLPFYFDINLRSYYTGSFMELINPFALLSGLTSLMMMVMHGGFYLAVKTEKELQARALYWARIAAIAVVLLFAIGGLAVSTFVKGYVVISIIDAGGYSNPLHKQVAQMTAAWLSNYSVYPWTIFAPVLGFLGTLLAFLCSYTKNSMVPLIFSGLGMSGIIATVGVSMFPFIVPSSSNLSSSLLVWDASSAHFTLLLMLICVIIFMPIILLYTAWVFRMLRGKVTTLMVEANKQSY